MKEFIEKIKNKKDGWRQSVIFLARKVDYKWFIPTILSIIAIAQPYIINSIEESRVTKTFYFVPKEVSADVSATSSKIECWTDSLATPRIDAFRCMHENVIYDPCFDIPLNGDFVSCPNTPHEDDLYFMVDKTKYKSVHDIFQDEGVELNDEEVSTSSHPWYITLKDGTGCKMVTGVTSQIAGYRMDYWCDSEEIKSLLLPIEKKAETEYINCWKGRSLQKCAIREIWH